LARIDAAEERNEEDGADKDDAEDEDNSRVAEKLTADADTDTKESKLLPGRNEDAEENAAVEGDEKNEDEDAEKGDVVEADEGTAADRVVEENDDPEDEEAHVLALSTLSTLPADALANTPVGTCRKSSSSPSISNSARREADVMAAVGAGSRLCNARSAASSAALERDAEDPTAETGE
jgi:hypothetical protein